MAKITLGAETSAKLQKIMDLSGKDAKTVVDAVLATPAADALLANIGDLVASTERPMIIKLKLVDR